ncbi:uncharacterized protein LOC144448555 isoform X1 [Glandiceps talaboti]
MKLLVSCSFLLVFTVVVVSSDSIAKRDVNKRSQAAWPPLLAGHVSGGNYRGKEKRWTPFIFNKKVSRTHGTNNADDNNGKRSSLQYDTVSDMDDVVKDVIAYLELRGNGLLDEVNECIADKTYGDDDSNAISKK